MAGQDKRSSGQRFLPPAAETWNAMVDAGEAYRNGLLNQNGAPKPRSRQTDIIKCKNVSGSARARGEVLGAFANPLTNLERDNIRLSGTAPTAGGHVGVCLDPVADGKTCERFQLSGVCVATVTISDESHEFAEIDPGAYKLLSAETGDIAIIYAPAGTGDQNCVVRLGGGAGGGRLFRFALTADHTAAGTVAADIKEMDGTAVESTTISDPEGVYVGLTDTTTGYAFKQDGVYYFDNANCPV